MINTYSMPLPIPKLLEVPRNVAELHYMSFEEAMLQPFSDEHHPSLQIHKKANNLIVGDVTLGDRETRSLASYANTITHQRSFMEWKSAEIA
jgi:hypothetical protein